MRSIALALACVCAVVMSITGQEPSALAVTMSSRTLTPGGVILLTIKSADPVSSLEGRAFSRPVPLWRAGDSEWNGLVPASLETKPGVYDIELIGAAARGGVNSKTRVTVQARQFETRRLKVGPEFVNPPAAESERIAREAKRLASIFTATTPRMWRGPFEPPVPGTATSSFGRLTVLNGESRGRHQGADFRAAEGTPVRAPNAGRVVLAEDLYFSGNTVVLDHGLGMFSLLAHLSHVNVAIGSAVARGDVLGASGATGRVTGPHLHWALRMGEFSVDPLSLMTVLTDLKEPGPPASPR